MKVKNNKFSIAGDVTFHQPKWHFILKIGTFVKFTDGGEKFVGQITAIDQKCNMGMHLKIRKMNESYWQSSYVKNHCVSGIHVFKKLGCWRPVYSEKGQTFPNSKYSVPLYYTRYFV